MPLSVIDKGKAAVTLVALVYIAAADAFTDTECQGSGTELSFTETDLKIKPQERWSCCTKSVFLEKYSYSVERNARAISPADIKVELWDVPQGGRGKFAVPGLGCEFNYLDTGYPSKCQGETCSTAWGGTNDDVCYLQFTQEYEQNEPTTEFSSACLVITCFNNYEYDYLKQEPGGMCYVKSVTITSNEHAETAKTPSPTPTPTPTASSSSESCAPDMTTSQCLQSLLPSTPACALLATEMVRVGESQVAQPPCGSWCEGGKNKPGEWCTIPAAFKQMSSDWPDEVCCGGADKCCKADEIAPGVIAGIVIGILVAVGGGVLGCYFGKICCFSYRKAQQQPVAATIAMTQPVPPAGGGEVLNPSMDVTAIAITQPVSHEVGGEMPKPSTDVTAPPNAPEQEQQPASSTTVESVLDAAKIDKAKFLAPLRELGVETARDLKDLTDKDMKEIGMNNLIKRRLLAEIAKL